MAIRTNPSKAVSLLLKNMRKVQKDEDLNDLKSDLIKIEDLFTKVKKNEEELLDTLTTLNGYLRSSNRKKLSKKEKEDIRQRIGDSVKKLLTAKEFPGSSSKTFQNEKLDKRGVGLFWSQFQDLEMLRADYNCLFDPCTRQCFHSLSIFPENAVIRKWNTIYWWFGIGSIKDMRKEGEAVFDKLLQGNLIVPHGNGKCPIVKKFKINPSIHHKYLSPLLQSEKQLYGIYSQMITLSHQNQAKHDSKLDCLALDQRKATLSAESGFKSNHWRAVFNVGASYLNFGPQWLAKMDKLEMLHLGRWQDSALHHIEVESEEFLKELRDHKSLRYLILRGISRIYSLPRTIFQLKGLEILDLKACHNLETLPNNIAQLKNLWHLDLSQCYLLERMPNGIEKLTNLQVLKGFVIGSPRMTSCRLSGLVNLKKLERLSIHIEFEAMIEEKEFECLKEMLELKHLKISWGVFGTKHNDIQILFPSSLVKLHLEAFPGQKIPEWLKPSKLHEKLHELYIIGGKLESIDHEENNKNWPMKIVRLKYLDHLNVDETKLKVWFPALNYAEIRKVKNHSYFEWSNIY